MKIMLMTDGPNTPSGLGNWMFNMINFLKNKIGDENLAILDWQYIGQKRTDYGKVTVYPTGSHTYAKDTLHLALIDFKPDILIVSGDYWMVDYLSQEDYQKLLKQLKIRLWYYITVDGDRVPIWYRKMFVKCDRVISPSEYGKKIIERDCSILCEHIPIGVDLNLYKKLPHRNDLKLRQKFNDKFVVGCIARNHERKQLPRLIEAFGIFAKDKEDVALYLHCDVDDPPNIARNYSDSRVLSLMRASIMTFLTNRLDEKVCLPPPEYNYATGYGLRKMVEIYNYFDIHVLSTSGEGFGIPIIESMACGVPNIMTDCTTANELIGFQNERGSKVYVADWIFSGYGSKKALVDVESLAKGIERFYLMWKFNKEEFEKYRQNCIEFAKTYDWSIIIKKWMELIV